MHRSQCTVRHISQLLKLSRNTVRRIIRGKTSDVPVKKSRHEPIESLVRQHFKSCKGNVVRLKEVLLEKYGHDVAYSSMTRIVRQLELREKKRRAGVYEFGPGEESQHDTSPHPLLLGDKKVRAECTSLTLGYCKKLFFQYYPVFTRFEAKVFLNEGVNYMQGGCARCVIDNTSVIIAAGSGADALISPEMEAFGKIFGMTFVAHRINDADRKAKVERNFHYIENNFLAGRSFADWHDLNRQARRWCDEVANKKPKRSMGQMSPEEIYLIEKPHLNPLPPHMPPVYKTLQRIVDMSGYVTVDTNRYSVPEHLCGQPVEVLKSWDHVTVYHKFTKVAEHKRIIDKRDGKIIAKGHHLPLHNTKSLCCQEEKVLIGRDESLDRYIVGIKKHTHFGRRKLQQLLELQRTYPRDAFKKAIEQALHYGLYDLSRLENLILTFVSGDFFSLETED
ncbi:MAG: IS21 family transposase [Pseudomonadota bacterium]